MYLLTTPFFLVTLIALLMMTLAIFLSKKSNNDLEKLSPFECGFDPQSTPRLSFSLHFFLILIIFLIFDIEITLIIPMITILKFCNILNWFMMTIMFIFILKFGLYLEWNQNLLNWSN